VSAVSEPLVERIGARGFPVSVLEEFPDTSWQCIQGGRNSWNNGGMVVSTNGAEWAGAELRSPWWQRLPSSRNLLLQVLVSGNAELAGLSFGDWKDFLAPLNTAPATTHCLQLELDRNEGYWLFRVDGRIQERQCWEGAIRNLDDIFGGPLTLKTRRPQEVCFRKLTIHPFESSCRLSIVMTCHRFLQRLRVTLGNWQRQMVDSGAFEIIIVNPESPDGVSEHVAAVAASCPHLRIREVIAPASFARNKGALINRGVRAARGSWTWLTDSDCLFDPRAVSRVLHATAQRKRQLYYCERRFLSFEDTQALLAGTADPMAEFDSLSERSEWREAQPYGYTQIVPADVLTRYRYREDINHFAESDLSFVSRCWKNQIRPAQIEGMHCLHLSHPFAWHGTPVFL
jgi:hypothetical protein